MSVRTLCRSSSIAIAAGVLACSAAHAATEPAGFIPFAPTSVWNSPVPATAALSADSASYVSDLKATVASHGAYFNVNDCGVPIYWADPTTPTVQVTLNHPGYQDPALMRAWSSVPMPAGAQPANCADKDFAVLQTQANGSIKEWEFWSASQSSTGAWTARWGGAIDNVLTDSGIASALEWTDPTAPTTAAEHSSTSWNVTASSISLLAGVVTNSDLESGQIDHALALAVPAAASGVWMAPANRTDGVSTDQFALPEGAHLRLDPSLDLSTLHLTPLARMLAVAAQRYGIIVRDQTWSSVAFIAEQPAAGTTSPASALLAGQSTSSAMAAFPWADLQVLNAPLCNASGCTEPSSRGSATGSGAGESGSGPVAASTATTPTTAPAAATSAPAPTHAPTTTPATSTRHRKARVRSHRHKVRRRGTRHHGRGRHGRSG